MPLKQVQFAGEQDQPPLQMSCKSPTPTENFCRPPPLTGPQEQTSVSSLLLR